jgi:peptidoglycan/LPS O-acetylase OafA/YrhL
MSSLERDGAPGRPGWVRRFYERRAWRIYPLALAVIGVVVLLKVPSANLPATYERVTAPQLLTNLLLVHDLAGYGSVLGVLWTLPMEIQMYVLLPFCYLVARKRAAWPIATLFAVGVAIMSVRLWGTQTAHWIPGIWRVRMLAFLPCFLVGVLAYWLVRRRRASWPTLPAWVWTPLILVDVAAMFAPFQSVAWSWYVRVAFCLVLGAAVPLVREAAASWFTRAAHTVAVYSYGVYLLHPLALRVGFGLLLDTPRLVQWGAFAASLVAFVYAAYHLIEKPGIAMGRRLIEGERRRVPSLEATAPVP